VAIVLAVAKESIIKHLKLSVFHHLGPVLSVLDGGSSGLMSGHDGHARVVEGALVRAADELDDVVAADLAIGTKVDKDGVEKSGSGEELFVPEQDPNVDHIKVCELLEKVVGDVSCCDHGTESDVSVEIICHRLV